MKTKILFFLGCLFYTSFLSAQVPCPDYAPSRVSATKVILSEEVLENYLERSITMSKLTWINFDGNVLYHGSSTPGQNPEFAASEAIEDIDMLVDMDAQFIGRVAGLWRYFDVIGTGYMAEVAATVTQINNAYAAAGSSVCNTQPIIQTAIFENVNDKIDGISPNAETESEFYFGNFNHALMQYDASSSSVPDITKVETRRWFYYLATEYIDAGIEAIHFGHIHAMSLNQTPAAPALSPTQAWADLLTKIRNYAAIHAPRNFVLCDGHLTGDSTNDLFAVPINGTLLFDFNSSVLPIVNERYTSTLPNWPNHRINGTAAQNGGPASIDYSCTPPKNFAKRPDIQGTTYFGWVTESLPYLVEFDNWGSANVNTFGSCKSWGWDQITWFALQDGIDGVEDASETYSNNFLKYAYYKVKCVNPKAHLQVTGRRQMTYAYGSDYKIVDYRAATVARAAELYYDNGSGTEKYFSNGGQQTTIKALWNGAFKYYWKDYNFSAEAGHTISPTPNNLIHVGDDKMFYINSNGYINGYIKHQGVWYPKSPAWYAHTQGQDLSTQIQAVNVAGKNTLTSNPAGTHLYYIGVDGNVHGYEINNIWSYTHFSIAGDPNINAINSIVCSGNNNIYFVANEIANNTNRIHGHHFVGPNNNNWVTMSPSWGAGGVSSQAEAVSSLVSNPSATDLYYVGADDYIHSYHINNWWSYSYTTLSTAILATDELICPKDHQLYFLSNLPNATQNRLCALIQYAPNNWTHTYVAAKAAISTTSTEHPLANEGTPIGNQVAAKASGAGLTVNASGTKIFYRGTTDRIHNYNILDDWNYSYNDDSNYSLSSFSTSNLATNSDDELYYIGTDAQVHVLRIKSCYNPNITRPLNEGGEPGFNPSTPLPPSFVPNPSATSYYEKTPAAFENRNSNTTSTFEIGSEQFNLNIYPNPTSEVFNLDIVSKGTQDLQVSIYSAIGQEVYNETLPLSEGKSLFTINSSLWITGIYMVSIQDNKGVMLAQRKLIKK